MAKDPATLWYWNDWQGGTMTLTRHQKGCYMDLLAAQFNSGPLSLEQIKTVLGTDQAIWTVLSPKFKKVVENHTTLFFNERMEAEKTRRKIFIEKQSLNGQKGGRPKNPEETQPLTQKKPIKENETEDENEIRNENKKAPPQKIFFPFESQQFLTAWEGWKDYKRNQHRFTYKSGSEQAALKHLSELSFQDEITAIKIIQQSISNGWKGLFELKNFSNEQSNRKNGLDMDKLKEIHARHYGSGKPA